MTTLRHLQRVASSSCRKIAASQCAGQQRRLFHAPTSVLFEKKIVKVPTMGDSITEGTIVEWTAAVGQGVQEGDVVAMVETDKVTVEIKAEVAGVVCQQFGEVDDTVEVGSNLYEIDTDAEATIMESTAASSEPEKSDAPSSKAEAPVAAAAAAAPLETDGSHRIPSIKFLGKDGWALRKSGHEATSNAASLTAATVVDGLIIKANYGRPVFSDAEMEALLSGGASLEPEVVAEVGWARHGNKM